MGCYNKIVHDFPHISGSRRGHDGSWIYNYLCNQCLSPLTLWVRIPLIMW